MRPLVLEDVVDRERYAVLRPEYRAAVIEHKRTRRLAVGENITLVFEDRETLRFQVQEMLWVEGIAESHKIQHELDTYNELMPCGGELSATLFVEITDGREIRPALDRLIGVDEHVELVLGGEAHDVGIPASFDSRQMDAERISAVQYIKWRLDSNQQRLFCDRTRSARVRIDHPNYEHEVEIPPATRSILIESLSQEPTCLLPRLDPAAGLARPEILFEADGVRALRPQPQLAPGHAIVEPGDPIESLLDLTPDQLMPLMAAVQQVAAEIMREFGACRVQVDMGRGSDGLRWHLFAPIQ